MKGALDGRNQFFTMLHTPEFFRKDNLIVFAKDYTAYIPGCFYSKYFHGFSFIVFDLVVHFSTNDFIRHKDNFSRSSMERTL